ncbi:DUF4389 domain-containing protein [Thalassovita sp.]|uniref:DUF4389 domain-containing protein n=1 Tax=Thalassovita sp. TaxID=1979401 RepID=UPI0029DE7791|nr:DUF4389 domain-containing protein [Thalassovita sp.]
MHDEEKLSGRLHGEQMEPDQPEGLLMRIVFILIIGMMMSVSQTILGALTLIQVVIMALNKGAPNENLADFGTDLGVWMAKAVRYMSAASNVKPWPWSELD